MIEIIDLKQERQPSCRAMICQLNAAEYEWTKSNGLNYIKLNDRLYNKLHELLKIAKQNSVDLLIFPELSIPEKFIEKIQDWSKEQGAIVISGSHYYASAKGFISRCPIIVQGNVYFTEKVSPSPLEKSPIKGDGIISGSKILKFVNTFIGTFSVLICSDYLDDNLKRNLDLQDLDILCIPSFQKDSDVYFRRMNIDSENSASGIYLFYANFIDHKHGDGNSSVFGAMDRLFSEKLMEKNYTNLNPDKKLFQFQDGFEYAIVDVDLKTKRPFSNRNINTQPNFFVISHNNQTESKDFNFIQKIAHDDERYKRIDDFFIEPLEFKQIIDIIDRKNIVFIIGDPGIGKTYTAAKLLKIYYEKGFEPIWFAGLEKEEREMQSKVLNNFSPTNNQIVYFEDPFGRTVFERRDTLFQVFSPLVDKLSMLNSKIIITSRKEVFEIFSQESLLEKEILQLKEELNIRKPSYNSEGLCAIFDKLAPSVCEWYDQSEFRELVYSAIMQKQITTPLAVRDLIFVTRHVKSLLALKESINKREIDTIKVFALEILTTSVTTKAILYLIFFCGTKGKPFLSSLFLSISKELKSLNLPINSFSFNVEIRTQLGYRIEQFGLIKTAYKFSHPVYEEALASLILSDTNSEIISKLIIEVFSKTDIKSTYVVINRFVIKYPEVSLVLFRHLLETNNVIEDKNIRLTLGQKLISTFFSTKNEEYFFLATKIFPLQEAVDDINNRRGNWGEIIQKLNLVERYLYNSPENFDSSLSKNIKWEKLFSHRSENFITPGKVLHLLSICISIAPISISVFIDKRKITFIKRTYLLLDKNDRERFYRLLKGQSIQSELRKYRKTIEEIEKEGIEKKLYFLRKVIFSEYKYYGILFVDKGAHQALNKPWINLLPVGITSVIGDFGEGSIVKIMTIDNKTVGMGVVEYSSDDLKKIMKHSSTEFQELIGYYHTSCAVKADYFKKLKNEDTRWVFAE